MDLDDIELYYTRKMKGLDEDMLIMTMRRLQMNLKFLGYYDGVCNGIKDDRTKFAIKEYQRDRGLKVDGIAGQITIDCIRAEIKAIQRELGVTPDGVAGKRTFAANLNKPYNLNWSEIVYFKKEEFTCKCGCGLNNINLKVVKVADKIRNHFGRPAIVTSGTRCKKHNEEVGGVVRSRHLVGKAIDFCIPGVTGDELLKYCLRLKEAGYLRYTYRIANSRCVHIDIE